MVRETTRRTDADVLIVGAGLAGLYAGRALRRAGLTPLVLEARDRVGGRVVNADIGDGRIVEMGGQWLAAGDSLAIRLVAEYGADLFRSYDTGTHLLAVGTALRRQRGSIPPLRPHALLELGLVAGVLTALSRTVSAARPWRAPLAKRWDAETMDRVIDRLAHSAEARAMLDAAVSTMFGAPPAGVTVLQALAYIRIAGSFAAVGEIDGGILADRVVGGSARIADGMAAELGDLVRLSTPVSALRDTGERVEITSGDTVFTAPRAIVAVPPALAGDLAFEPALPPERTLALRSLPMASVIKTAAVYDRPFWRERGLSGRTMTLDGPVTATFDNSPPEGSPGVLIAFVPGARGREMSALDPEARRKSVLDALIRLFGAEAGEPVAYHEHDWNDDPWTRGCYFGLATPGALTGPLRTLAVPHGNIHWAGSETCFENYGGMEGALRSGERAAREVLGAATAACTA
ncbi:flavin monoamine oxidase family protein [Nocardia harenae]|uniref:flavin monoamine oxidase family protein n=1 Tax=Nocardia harenae TaxID=358707 RepID=UPI00082A2F6A|nr:FAD-dependent oxidoreductase [Nocardia harenae]